jgi:hypothetical protein
MSLPYKATVAYDHEAADESEMSITIGDKVVVSSINESGWALVDKAGASGWVPVDFLTRDEEADVVPPPPAPAADASPAPAPAAAAAEPNPAEVAAALSKLSVAAAAAPAAASAPAASSGAAAAVSADGSSTCFGCERPISGDGSSLIAKARPFHTDCFKCSTCSASLAGVQFLEKDAKYYCEGCYYAAHNPRCAHCNEVIMGSYVNANGLSYHPDHFTCSLCSCSLKGAQYRLHEQKPVCDACYDSQLAVRCTKCGENITGQVSVVKDRHYHRECFTCEFDGHVMQSDAFHLHEGAIYCPEHFLKKFGKFCKQCSKIIEGEYLQVLDFYFHSDCWTCGACKAPLAQAGCSRVGDLFVCSACAPAQREALAKSQAASGTASAAATTPAVGSAAASGATTPSGRKSIAHGGADVQKVRETVLAQGLARSSSDDEKPAAETFPEQQFYSYEQLKDNNKLPASVNKGKKEQLLTDADFAAVFGMTKSEFGLLQPWRQGEVKKQKGLY